jgi:hypothetical protein
MKSMRFAVLPLLAFAILVVTAQVSKASTTASADNAACTTVGPVTTSDGGLPPPGGPLPRWP